MKEEIVAGQLSRYDMSYYTYRQFQRDHIRFKGEYAKKFSNSFICRILINYINYALDDFWESFSNGMLDYLENYNYNHFRKEKYKHYVLTLTNKLENTLSKLDCKNEKSFKKRAVINYILEQFTLLPLSEREKVFFYDQYKAITKSLDESKMLIVKYLKQQYEVKPFSFKIDENNLSYYLVGYSKIRGSNDEFGTYCFKLSRIGDCYSNNKKAIINDTDRGVLRYITDKYGVAYIAGNHEEDEKVVVRLTEYGYNTLYSKVISHQRPICISEPVTIKTENNIFYDLKFDCSHKQIRNYFFSFGENAEIIEPKKLREDFINDYKQALKRYEGDD